MTCEARAPAGARSGRFQLQVYGLEVPKTNRRDRILGDCVGAFDVRIINRELVLMCERWGLGFAVDLTFRFPASCEWCPGGTWW